MKKILVIALILLSVFFIYLNTIDKKVYYLALGDSIAAGVNSSGTSEYGYTDHIKTYLENRNLLETYIDEFAASGYRSIDLKRDIEDNKKITINDKEITLKNALIKADLVTLSIGSNDFFYYINANPNDVYDHINTVISDLEDLFKLLREYCKEDIIIIGYYTPFKEHENLDKIDDIIKFANKKLEELCTEYKMHYVDVFDLFKENDYLPNSNDIHPSLEGYEAISKEIIKVIDKTLFKWYNRVVYNGYCKYIDIR